MTDGAAVYRQGDPPDGLYAVVEGQVRLTGYSPQGIGFLLLLAGPGEWFGEASSLDDGPRQQDAVSHGNSVVLHISHGDLAKIGAETPGLWRAIGRMASLHQRAALASIRNLLSMPAAGRVALLLQALDGRRPGVPLSIAQDELAANVGLSRQTVNAVLQDLRRRGLIELGYGSVRVTGDLTGIAQGD
ncbi:Crp/Fnr family transcriptional regulator [Sphingomonas sp. 2R-10]|uniref:Crp/Fnr family transcriptional regulator n=1 Tax=Sphingomonas sp. 2R-10 TaxID=3045148 RepID=UPI0013DE2C56|nr:Crp/Fnr family transcriptional regulator [Sphingomonas sp. 2R-10]MDJ0276435.1 Crp/Fnr family transcriptional regulator [Sphingomonas sp. 2R-10]